MANNKLTVPKFAHQFMHAWDKVPENPTRAIHERWEDVLTLCPFTRGRAIHEDFDADLTRAYRSDDIRHVFGASELALLRWRFFSLAYTNGIGMRHIAHYETQSAWAWMRKFTDKLGQMQENKRRAPKEKRVELKHSWLN